MCFGAAACYTAGEEGAAILDSTTPRTIDGLASLPRARGSADLRVVGSAPSRIADLHQSGSLKVLFPRRSGPALQAVCINTAGGVTGGDRFLFSAAADPGASLTVSTQACERAYRSLDGAFGTIGNRLQVARGAQVKWLPQETILFEASALNRTLNVALEADARCLIAEPLVFGRTAMGETVAHLRLRDEITVQRDGVPIYCDRIRWDGATGPFASAAILDGAKAMATIVMADPRAEGLLTTVRELLPKTAGATLLAPDLLAARLLARDSFDLRASLEPLVGLLSGEDLPKVWTL